jgi:hypothetical protein
VKYIAHRKWQDSALVIDFDSGEYINLPAFMLFDEACRVKGRAELPSWGFREFYKIFELSNAESTEIGKNWFYNANTICHLATQTSLDLETIERYYEYSEVGE